MQQDTSSTHSDRGLVQMLGIFVVLLVLVNIPLDVYGTGLAQWLPERPSIVIQEGMLLQDTAQNVYRLENHKLRRITSPELQRRYFGYRRATPVDDQLLAQFERGLPVRRWVTCRGSTQIYALEERQKRLCSDECPALPTSPSGPWDRVQTISCERLNSYADGPPLDGVQIP